MDAGIIENVDMQLPQLLPGTSSLSDERSLDSLLINPLDLICHLDTNLAAHIIQRLPSKRQAIFATCKKTRDVVRIGYTKLRLCSFPGTELNWPTYDLGSTYPHITSLELRITGYNTTACEALTSLIAFCPKLLCNIHSLHVLCLTVRPSPPQQLIDSLHALLLSCPHLKSFQISSPWLDAHLHTPHAGPHGHEMHDAQGIIHALSAAPAHLCQITAHPACPSLLTSITLPLVSSDTVADITHHAHHILSMAHLHKLQLDVSLDSAPGTSILLATLAEQTSTLHLLKSLAITVTTEHRLDTPTISLEAIDQLTQLEELSIHCSGQLKLPALNNLLHLTKLDFQAPHSSAHLHLRHVSYLTSLQDLRIACTALPDFLHWLPGLTQLTKLEMLQDVPFYLALHEGEVSDVRLELPLLQQLGVGGREMSDVPYGDICQSAPPLLLSTLVAPKLRRIEGRPICNSLVVFIRNNPGLSLQHSDSVVIFRAKRFVLGTRSGDPPLPPEIFADVRCCDERSSNLVEAIVQASSSSRPLLHICIRLTPVDDIGLKVIVRHCPHLLSLSVESRHQTSDVLPFSAGTVHQVASTLTQLTRLCLVNCQDLDDSCVEALASRCRRLRQLELDGVAGVLEPALLSLTQLSGFQVTKEVRLVGGHQLSMEGRVQLMRAGWEVGEHWMQDVE